MKFIIINGPNLNLLGKRQPEIYGKKAFLNYFEELQKKFPEHKLEYFQSNHAGELIDKIHEVGFTYDGIILNAAAYSHTSVALADAVAAIKTDVIEVHITNTYSREPYRHQSYISQFAKSIILGFGLDGYEMAIDGLLKMNKPQD